MQATPIINNLNGGEVSPKIAARGDIDKYSSCCLLLDGFFPLVEGGVQRVPGTKFVSRIKYYNSILELYRVAVVVPFQFSGTQSYVLEIGHQYIRFYQGSTRIEVSGTPVEVATPYPYSVINELKFRLSNDVMYIFHKDYQTTKLTRLSHTEWQLNAVSFRPPLTKENGLSGSTTLTLGAVTGDAITFTAGSAFFYNTDIGRGIISGAGRAYIVEYVSATVVKCDIIDDFADVGPISSGEWEMTLSPSFYLTPSSTKKGRLCTINFSGARLNLLDGVNDNWLPSSANDKEYYLTESSPLFFPVEPNNVIWKSSVAASGTLGSLATHAWGFGDNDSLGYDTIYFRRDDTAADPDDLTVEYATDKVKTWIRREDSATNISIFRAGDVGKFIYMNGGCVKIEERTSSFSVRGEILDSLSTDDATGAWTLEDPIWSDATGWPSFGAFFEQRLVLGGATEYPQTIGFSVSGDYENFALDGSADDAAISFTLVSPSNEVETIYWAIGNEFMIAGTSGGIWKMEAADNTQAFSAKNFSFKKHINSPAADIQPVVAGEMLMWVDHSRQKLYTLEYSLDKDKYIPSNMNRLASHIAIGDSIADSGFKQIVFHGAPYPIVWAVRQDGQLLGMTMDSQENVYGWFRVNIDGAVQSICVTRNEGGEDTLTLAIDRDGYINIEQMTPFDIYGDIADSFFVHAGASYNAWDDSLLITGISALNPVKVYAANTFVGGERIAIRNVRGLTNANTTGSGYWTVANPTASTFELSGVDGTSWEWAEPISYGGDVLLFKNSFTTGLDHLEGKEVDIVVDGAVHPRRTVTDGALALSWYGLKVNIGLPITATVQPTQPFIGTGSGVSRGNKQRINRIDVDFYETYGGQYGASLDEMYNFKFTTGVSPALATTIKSVTFPGDWGDEANLFIRQSVPLPMTIRSIKYKLSVNEN